MEGFLQRHQSFYLLCTILRSISARPLPLPTSVITRSPFSLSPTTQERGVGVPRPAPIVYRITGSIVLRSAQEGMRQGSTQEQHEEGTRPWNTAWANPKSTGASPSDLRLGKSTEST